MLDYPMQCTMPPAHVLASGQQRSVEDVGILNTRDIIAWLPLLVEELLMPCLLVHVTRLGSVLPAGSSAPMPLVRLKRKPTPLPPHRTNHSAGPQHLGIGMRSTCGQ
jgi:hypothetical protein